jgi:hypothetical protein
MRENLVIVVAWSTELVIRSDLMILESRVSSYPDFEAEGINNSSFRSLIVNLP